MNESDIAAALAARMPKPDVSTESVPVNIKQQPEGETGYVDSKVIDETTRYKLMDFLNIAPNMRGDLETIKMVERIAMWATERGSSNINDMMMAMRMVQRALGKEDLKTLYAYAKLDVMQKQLNDEYRLLMS